jgi:hypothetical protein
MSGFALWTPPLHSFRICVPECRKGTPRRRDPGGGLAKGAKKAKEKGEAPVPGDASSWRLHKLKVNGEGFPGNGASLCTARHALRNHEGRDRQGAAETPEDRLMKIKMIYVLVCAAIAPSAPALAQNLFVYPAGGQTTEQMNRDRADCNNWARQQTGFDPSMPAPAAGAPPPQGQVARGAVRGAAAGAVGGAIAGDAGRGAAIGAGGGALIGGMRRRSDTQAHEAQEAQQQAAANQGRNDFNRAYTACLEGKGYTVR